MTNILVTGANGEMGHVLIPELKRQGHNIVTLDVSDADQVIKGNSIEFVKDTVLNKITLSKLFTKYTFDTIFHLSAILSVAAENDPDLAQTVNAGGTFSLLSVANTFASKNKTVIKFIFPSTVAVYGLPDLKTKNENTSISEEEFLHPITIYGITKLYCENLGAYYSSEYELISNPKHYIDFRAIRFPGIISALQLPKGETDNVGSAMMHTAAQGKSYESSVGEDTILPFMAMPDAINAIIQLSEVSKEKLTRLVYNVSSFSISSKEIADIVLKIFPNTTISYNPNPARQKIVDSWPVGIDDSLARRDWGWNPSYDAKKTFEDYLIPEIQSKMDKTS